MQTKRFSSHLLLLPVLMFWTTIAAAGLVSVPRTWYVNVATGSDSNSGMSAGTPFQWITKGMSSAISGDTIMVAPGTYYVLPSC
jgi:Protein of unknown function (DUF1565)